MQPAGLRAVNVVVAFATRGHAGAQPSNFDRRLVVVQVAVAAGSVLGEG